MSEKFVRNSVEKPEKVTGSKKEDWWERDVTPLSELVDDPEELIEQSFQAIEREELVRMLPVILQTLPEEEVKRLCLQQVANMRREEIVRIIEGHEWEENEKISSTATSGFQTKDDINKVVAEASDALDLFPESEDVEMLLGGISNESEKSTQISSNSEKTSPSPSKMQMEIVELEFRARAIKALLRSQQPEASGR